MARSVQSAFRYPFAVVRTATGVSAGALQFPAMATAASMDELLPLLEQQVALYLLDRHLEGDTPQPPKAATPSDLRDYEEEGDTPEVVYVQPAPMSVVSVAIERALREEGLSQAEMARRMNVPRSVVSRIVNPFYFGHSSRTLRSVATALGRDLHVSIDRPESRSDRTRREDASLPNLTF
ncbi:MAG: XRE family transcriptional regulator [Trueperaceae bacterium]